jgi:hypothetical protein
VLLIDWEINDLGTAEDVERLKTLFESTFGYKTFHFQIPHANPQGELQTELSIRARDLNRVQLGSKLLIVYYGGHGNLNKEDKSEWQAWAAKPPGVHTFHSTKLDWTKAPSALEDTDGDVLYLLDCCQATSMAKGIRSGTQELIAACGTHDRAGGDRPNGFTQALIVELREIKGRRYSASLLHEVMVDNERKHGLEVTPVHVFRSGQSDPSSIAIRPLNTESRIADTASGPHSDVPPFSQSCRVLISVSFENDDVAPILTEWHKWLLNTP